MKIAMTVSNNAINDVRVMREAKTLAEAGHKIYIFGLSQHSEEFTADEVKIVNSKQSCLSRIIIAAKNIYRTKTQKKIIIAKPKTQNNQHLSIKTLTKGLVIRYIIESNQNKIYKKIKQTKVKFDCIHCHDLDTLGIGVKLKQKQNIKLIYDSHELWTEMTGINAYVKKKYTSLEKAYLKFVDTIITVSPPVSEEIRSRYSYEGQIELIRNIPFFENIDNPTKPNPQKMKLLYVGYSLEGRGLEELLEAAKEFPANAHVFFRVQNKAAINHLKEIASNNCIDEKVTFQEFVSQSDLIKEISRHDVGLIPYLPISQNGLCALPNKLFQYMAGGVCIISRDLPEIKKIIDEHECGETYSNIQELTNIIKNLVKKPDMVLKFKENSLKASKCKLNWQQEKQKLIKAYEVILRK